jgi:TIR domain
MVFISYSRKDTEEARKLYHRLQAAGYPLWFDEQDLLPGQDWELETQKAIRRCDAVVTCLSSKWVNDRGYVQKELKITLEVLKEMPEGKLFIVPVKLDECEAPFSLSKLHWIRLSEPGGFERLRKALDSATGLPKSTEPASRSASSWREFLEETIAKGGMIYSDPWTSGRSKKEVVFKKLLKGRLDTGFDLLAAEKFEDVLKLWQPLVKNPFFRVEHTEWQDKPYFRCHIHSAKCQLFYAYVYLNQRSDHEERVRKAFRLLQEILLGNPYSLQGGSHDRLSVDLARTQNLNYKDALNFALEWYKSWGGYFKIAGISTEESEAVKIQIYNRLEEIDFILESHPESRDDNARP